VRRLSIADEAQDFDSAPGELRLRGPALGKRFAGRGDPVRAKTFVLSPVQGKVRDGGTPSPAHETCALPRNTSGERLISAAFAAARAADFLDMAVIGSAAAAEDV